MHITVGINWCCSFEVSFLLPKVSLTVLIQMGLQHDLTVTTSFISESILTTLIHHNMVGIWSCCLKGNWFYSNLHSKSDKLQINIIAKNDRQSIKNWKWWHVRTVWAGQTLFRTLIGPCRLTFPAQTAASWAVSVIFTNVARFETCLELLFLENKPCLSNIFQWQATFLFGKCPLDQWLVLVCVIQGKDSCIAAC